MQLLKALGLVATGKRAIQSGLQYNQYFVLSGVHGQEVSLMANGNVSDTIALMKKIVADTLPQTKRIAQVLKGSTRLQTASNVWDFLYNHVQYTKDNPLREQLRTPLRTWHDRRRGVDCDCYSIFISSVLTNLGVPHFFRVAGYHGGDYQHVYVVVPDGSRQIIIDPVMDEFNKEQPYTSKKDFNMKVTMLNGLALGACPAPTPGRPVVANQQLPNPVLQENDIATFAPIEMYNLKAVPDQPAPAPVQAAQPEIVQAKAATTNGEKILWGLGLSALALAVFSAFQKKPSLSGTPKSERKRLSVVQL